MVQINADVHVRHPFAQGLHNFKFGLPATGVAK